PNSWFPVPDLDTLPEVVELLNQLVTEAPPIVAEPEPQAKRAPARTSRRPHVGRKAIGAGLAVFAVLVAAVAYAVPKLSGAGEGARADAAVPAVELTVGDSTTTISSDAATVGAALEAEGVKIRPGDEVTPPLETAISDGLTIVVTRAVTVYVDQDGAITEAVSTADSVKEFQRETPELAGKKFITDPNDPIDVKDPLTKNGVYTFRTPRDVTYFLGIGALGQQERTTALTVGEFISSRGIPVAPGDYVNPPVDTPIPLDGSIEIRMLSSAEFSQVRDAFNHAALDRWLDGAITTGPNGPIGPWGGPVPGPAGIPPSGNSQSGTATYYEFTPGTCAHLSLPFGTVVHLRNPATGATATCTVADRGPEQWTGHVIDLTPGVFAQLAPLSQGVVFLELSW
ncbi:MAG: ubiquitin-like domain-containing protein, partial [Acidimicrobiia bacterium]